MQDSKKSKAQLIEELQTLRSKLADLEGLPDQQGLDETTPGQQMTKSKSRTSKKQLIDREKELELTLDATTEGIWAWNFITEEMTFSRRYYQMLGYEPGEFPSSYDNWLKLIHPDDVEAAKAVANEWIKTKTGKYENEFRLRTKTGDYIWVSAHGKVVEYDEKGKAVRMIGNHADINKRKLAEQALRANEARLRQAQKLTKIGYWDWSVDTGEFQCSDEVFQIFDRDPGTFQPTIELFEASIHPDDLRAFLEERNKALAEQREGSIEHRILLTNGEVRYVHERAEIIRDEKGNVRRVVGAVQDITKRKESEAKLMQSIKEKDILIRELYHRTKNTMQVISSMLSISALNSRNAEVRKLVEDTKNRIRAMSLVHQMLYRAQDLSNVNIKAYIEELTRILWKTYPATAKRVNVELDVESMPVIIDTLIPCGLVLNELLTNALQHAFPGEKEGFIRVELARQSPGKIKLIVSDNGIGVPGEFDFSSQQTFGLKSVMAIVEQQMQGTVSFSKQNGVTCCIEFPDDLYQSRV